jgi:hypothetical protein
VPAAPRTFTKRRPKPSPRCAIGGRCDGVFGELDNPVMSRSHLAYEVGPRVRARRTSVTWAIARYARRTHERRHRSPRRPAPACNVDSSEREFPTRFYIPKTERRPKHARAFAWTCFSQQEPLRGGSRKIGFYEDRCPRPADATHHREPRPGSPALRDRAQPGERRLEPVAVVK